MKKIPMILLAMFTLSGCDRQEMIYSFNHVEEASVDNEVENTESVDNIQAETEQAVDITTEETEISDVYSGPTVTLAMVGDVPVKATISGVIRGLIRDGYPVFKGMKIADIDPRAEQKKNCFTISDKARCIAGGVLEVLLSCGILPDTTTEKN